MNTVAVLLSVIIASNIGVSGRTFTVTNKCSYTVWPAIFTDLNAGTAVPDHPTGWEAPAGNTTSFTVPDNWKSGRIWGRRNCDFSRPAVSACSTGSCNGGLLCDPHTGTGIPPVTVAEWTLAGSGTEDNYDVSLVDGFNIPMAITNSKNCPVASCPADLNPKCPARLAVAGPGGNAGCKSACAANVDGNQGDSPNCCSGSHNTPTTCPPSGVQFYDYFKKPCPDSYAYAYDESSKTALWTCDSTQDVDYTLTFCP